MKTAKEIFVSSSGVRSYKYSWVFEDRNFNNAHKNISIAFQEIFMFSSAFFLALISLERAYYLICPLRHRISV